jgi:hypothetical protein
MAELLAGAVHQAVELRNHGVLFEAARRAWASQRTDPFPYPARELRAAARTLDELSQEWAALPAGADLALSWP